MAFDAFLKLDGIDGESKDSKHTKEIDLLSFSWGAAQTGGAAYGGGSGTGKVSVSDFSITKRYDSASPLLFLKCCNGTHIPNAVVTLRKAGGDQQEYLKFTFTEVLVSNLSTSGASGGDDVPVETVALNFATCKTEYYPQNADGSLGGVVPGGWDLKQNIPVA